MLIQNETLFNQLIYCFKHESNFEKFLSQSCKKNEYATNLNIVSTSLLLNKTIYSFVVSKELNTNVKHIYSIRKNNYQKVLIGLVNEHFFPILIKNSNINFKKCIDLNDYNFEDRFIDFD